ncbi:MAG: RhuM family protein [Bacteroidales bacterium]|nr:virulence RhuM family protein [Bacteroidales bacterium]MDD2204273.1 RhuM family protein [Bacteroidales bacterium]MDD3913154.1 RhuM family protein [Bacteroidales bacterium]MDD4633069.1 RhuM family protein [Bacteroidales bacterium]
MYDIALSYKRGKCLNKLTLNLCYINVFASKHFNNLSNNLYQPDNSVKLEVRVENETVWLTQAQIAALFGTQRQAITKHLRNIFAVGELTENLVSSILELTAADGKKYQTKIYSLDAILSVGYRVNSINATQFRIWANKVLKGYIMKGYAINQRFERIEDDVYYLKQKTQEFDLVVKTSLPPREGLFYDGQIFDAFEFVQNIIKSAQRSIVLIDNYIDDSVLTMLGNKAKDITVNIYTKSVSEQLKLAAVKFNSQYGGLILKEFSFSHDRFLIIDDKEIYLIGASLKDLGKKWFAFSKLDKSNIADIKKRLT